MTHQQAGHEMVLEVGLCVHVELHANYSIQENRQHCADLKGTKGEV